MKRKGKYICTKDLQSDDFAVGLCYSIEEWRQQALFWCNCECSNNLYDEIKKLPRHEVINYIQDLYGIVIEKYKPKKEH